MFYLTATGRGDTPTAGWQYDYHGRPGRNWALRDGGRVDRHPTLVGSVIRVKPHGQSRAREVLPFIAVKPQQAREDMGTYDLPGSWTYRSFRNDAQGPPPRPNGLILQEAILKLETKPETVPARRSPEPPFAIIEPSYTKTILGGTIEWSGRVLDIKGEVLPVKFEGRPQEFWFSATGRGGTASAGWQYDYHGDMTRTWPKGDRQVPALVGTVIRQKAHGDSPAGIVYPFIAVQQ